MFIDRQDAGSKLANKLGYLKGKEAIVVSIPRGGVVIGAEIARSLSLPLNIVIPRKIGAPGNPELAIGAVAGEGMTFLNENLIHMLGVSKEYLDAAIKYQVEEIKRREGLYLQGRKQAEVSGKIAVVVDDGLATGATAIAAVRALKGERPAKIILAVPVAPVDSKKLLEKEADEVIVLETPSVFYAVGQFYESFEQTTDEEVKELLRN